MILQKYHKGQTILETVIAATLIAVAVVAAISLSTNTQKETSYSRDLSVATKYNYQVIDWVKNVNNQIGWAALYAKIDGDASPVYCLSTIPSLAVDFSTMPQSSKDSCETSLISGTQYYRVAEFTIVGAGADTLDLKVTTYWPGRVEHSASTETTITNH